MNLYKKKKKKKKKNYKKFSKIFSPKFDFFIFDRLVNDLDRYRYSNMADVKENGSKSK